MTSLIGPLIAAVRRVFELGYAAPIPATSGLLAFGITGRAVLPLIGGMIGENAATLNPVFYVPLVGYALLWCPP